MNWNHVLLGAGATTVVFAVVVGGIILLIWWLNRRGNIRLKFDPSEHGVQDTLRNWRDQL